MGKRRETYVATPRGRRLAGFAIGMAMLGFLVLCAWVGTTW